MCRWRGRISRIGIDTEVGIRNSEFGIFGRTSKGNFGFAVGLWPTRRTVVPAWLSS